MENVLIKIAFRNLKEHKTKTLIIGILVMLGIMILVVGNSFINTATKGIEDTYIANYTGNVIVTSSDVESPTLTMPMMSGDMEDSIPIIPEFTAIKKYAESLSQVKSVTEQIDGMATIKWEDKGESFFIAFGVDPISYKETFPDGIKIVEGEFLKPGEAGIVLAKEVAEELNKSSGDVIQPGDKILVTAMSGNSGTKIRELTVFGIHQLSGSSPELALACFVDPENMRILNGITLNTLDSVDLSTDEEALLGGVDEDDLFGSENDLLFTDVYAAENKTGIEDWDSILGDTSVRDYYSQTDPEGWHYMMIKLIDGNDTKRTIKELNLYFDENGINAKAWNWIDGAGISAQLANTMKIAFNVLVMIVAIVAAIIIMNTLVISVTERIGEIGTMRAIGARKGFVRMMITWETIMISVVFGVIGMILGVLIITILGAVGIPATNMFLKVLLGGDIFRPVISASSMILSLVVITLIGVIASLYPVSVALKISPVRAMSE